LNFLYHTVGAFGWQHAVWVRLTAKIWFGRIEGSGGAPFVTSCKQPVFSFQKRRLKLQFATVAVAVALLTGIVTEPPSQVFPVVLR
jgi:hypothetical protein